MFYPGFGYGQPVGRFEQDYHVYPVSFLDKTHLENGDKIIMPPSALDRLASLHIDYPMLFEVTNTAVNRKTHCGVLEFVAEEGCVYMPYWMMQNLLVQEGDLIRLTNATLKKGTYVKLQPHTKDFLDISNPKAVLETTLRNFSCLTVGDNIMVAYNNKKYYIDIVEARPDPAITIIETDCEVDFAAPLDYVEPTYVRAPPAAASNGAAPKAAAGPTFKGLGAAAKKKDKEEAAPPEPEEPKFQPFVGSGRRLDGKPASPAKPGALGGSATGAAAASSTQQAGGGAPAAAAVGDGSVSGSAPAAAAPAAPRTGRLVFGNGAAAPAAKGVKKEKKEEAKAASKEPEGPKFEAFKGKGYSLK